jgi:hypothetical protein
LQTIVDAALVICGVGLTVTLYVKDALLQPLAEGITKYRTVIGDVVVFTSVSVIVLVVWLLTGPLLMPATAARLQV